MTTKTLQFGLALLLLSGLPVVNVLAEAPSALSGTYLDSDGSPLSISAVSLFDSTGERLLTSVTNMKGAFEFSGIKVGDYLLKFTKSGAPDVWYGGDDKSPVTVGKAGATVKFTYPKGLSLAGTYLDSDGSPLSISAVSLFDSTGERLLTAVTNMKGVFEFSGLKAGDYLLKFTKSGAPDVWYGGDDKTPVTVGKASSKVKFAYPKSLMSAPVVSFLKTPVSYFRF